MQSYFIGFVAFKSFFPTSDLQATTQSPSKRKGIICI
jgi:hypothetical protein